MWRILPCRTETPRCCVAFSSLVEHAPDLNAQIAIRDKSECSCKCDILMAKQLEKQEVKINIKKLHNKHINSGYINEQTLIIFRILTIT